MVTNDMFKDHIEKAFSPEQKAERRDWVKLHCISFTFVGDEFIPNPDFRFDLVPSLPQRQ